MICPIDNPWDNIALNSTTVTNTTHTIYIPAFKDILNTDTSPTTVTATFSTFGGSYTSLNGITYDDIVHNGEVSFSFSFPALPVGTATGYMNITSSSGLQSNISVSINVVA